jgi:hypothetical protein
VARGDAPAGFDDIHRILGGPMREVDPALWPERPHHGGPLPVLSTAAQAEVALVIAAAARTLAPPPDLAAFDALIALTTEALPRKQLDTASQGKKSDHVGIKVAKLVVRTTLNHLYAAPSARNTTGTCAENAAIALVKHVAADRPDDAHDFLCTLDDAIVTRELAEQLAARDVMPTSPLARVVSRPRTPGKKSFGIVLAALADGRFGLYAKLRQKWEWHEGDRATVFATVPDAFMELVIADLDRKP